MCCEIMWIKPRSIYGESMGRWRREAARVPTQLIVLIGQLVRNTLCVWQSLTLSMVQIQNNKYVKNILFLGLVKTLRQRLWWLRYGLFYFIGLVIWHRVSLRRPGWSWTHRGLLASAFRVKGVRHHKLLTLRLTQMKPFPTKDLSCLFCPRCFAFSNSCLQLMCHGSSVLIGHVYFHISATWREVWLPAHGAHISLDLTLSAYLREDTQEI